MMSLAQEGIKPSPLLCELFPGPVVAFQMHGFVEIDSLHPKERALVAQAAPRRMREFATGRACARAALAELQIEDFPVLVGAMREPLWPKEITGSVTHDRDFCGAVVAEKRYLASVGVDAVSRGAVSHDLWGEIAIESELHYLGTLPDRVANDAAGIIFGAKEAFYKCQYQLTHQWLNFSDVGVTLEVEAGRFRIRPHGPMKLGTLMPEPWIGRFQVRDKFIFAGIGFPTETSQIDLEQARETFGNGF